MAVKMLTTSSPLSTSGGLWMRAEAYNITYGVLNSSTFTNLDPNTARAAAVTFANAGNQQGLGLMYRGRNLTSDGIFKIWLNQIKGTCTMTTASPTVVTYTAHGYSTGQAISFSTTGSFTGISANTTYYVNVINANTFYLYLTQALAIAGGAGRQSVTAQTGTHTLWTCVTENFFDAATSPDTSLYGFNYFPLTSYAVDTTAGKWRYTLSNTVSGVIQLETTTASASDFLYAAFLDVDTTKTAANDYLILKQGVTLTPDENATWGVAADHNTAIIYGKSSYIQNTNPAGAITWSLNGDIRPSQEGGFVIGSQATPLTSSNRFTITQLTYAQEGTGVPVLFYNNASSVPVNRGTVFSRFKIEFWSYEDPYIAGFAATTALAGQPYITLTQDLSAQWQIGDQLSLFGKKKTSSDAIVYTIAGIVGTTLQLNTNLDYDFLAGGEITNVSRNVNSGVVINGYAAGGTYGIFSNGFNEYVKLVGVYFTRMQLFLGTGAKNFGIQYTQTDNVLVRNILINNSNQAWPVNGSFNNGTISGIYKYGTVAASSSNYTFLAGTGNYIEKIYSKNGYGTAYVSNIAGSGGISIVGVNTTAKDIGMFNGALLTGSPRIGILLSGVGMNLSNVMVYGAEQGLATTSLYNSTITNANVDGCSYNYFLQGGLGNTFINCKGGTITQETTGWFYTYTDTINQYLFKNSSLGASPILTDAASNISNTLDGSYVKFDTYNTIANDHRGFEKYGSYVSTGYGLSDTTVWGNTGFGAASAGQFGMARNPNNSTTLYIWDLYNGSGKLVGNQQYKTLYARVRIKVNNAAFYAGVYTLPTLRVVFDGSTTASTVASANTNDQELVVKFSPQTTNPRIDVYLDMATDATGTNRLVYVGQAEVTLPDNASIDNTSLSYWSNALPLAPDATIPTQESLWVKSTQVDYGTSSFGNQLKVLKNPSFILDGEVVGI